jgi:hypothetical protein
LARAMTAARTKSARGRSAGGRRWARRDGRERREACVRESITRGGENEAVPNRYDGRDPRVSVASKEQTAGKSERRSNRRNGSAPQ